MDIQVIVINLASAGERLSFQKAQWERLGLAFERLEAVAAADVTEADYIRLASCWERPLRRTELAAYFSHRKAWQRVADSGVPALVLEDDALLSRHVPALLSELADSSDIDFVTLEVRGRKKLVGRHSLPLVGNSRLLPLYQDRTGAAAYVLWPAGAHKLLADGRRKGAALADALIYTCYALRAYQVEPAAAIQLDQCAYYGLDCDVKTESSISPATRPVPQTQRLVDRLGFKWRRIHGQLRIGIRHLSVMGRSERREIALRPEDFSMAGEKGA